MIRNAFKRAVTSFCAAVSINVVICTIVLLISKDKQFAPVLPEFAAYFGSKTEAMMVQLVLIGIGSATFAGGTVIFEMERLSMLLQSLIYFIVTALAWVPISCVCWRIHEYPQSFCTVLISYVISYMICWIVQYRLCRESVHQINQKLEVFQAEHGKE